MIQETNEKFDYLFKIVVIGDASVGKSKIITRLVKNEFLQDSKPTIGVDFTTKTFKFENSVVKIQIWDTAGQERYHAIVSAYYRGASGAVIVYDVTNTKSIENIRTIWLKNLRNVSEESIPIMILGNKKDLTQEIKVSRHCGEELSMAENAMFFETSALLDNGDENINRAFMLFIKQIYEKEKNNQIQSGKKAFSNGNQRHREAIPKKKRDACC